MLQNFLDLKYFFSMVMLRILLAGAFLVLGFSAPSSDSCIEGQAKVTDSLIQRERHAQRSHETWDDLPDAWEMKRNEIRKELEKRQRSELSVLQLDDLANMTMMELKANMEAEIKALGARDIQDRLDPKGGACVLCRSCGSGFFRQAGTVHGGKNGIKGFADSCSGRDLQQVKGTGEGISLCCK